MARSSSMKKQFSTFGNKSSNEERIMNYEAAYTLQENNIHLQDAERKMIKQLINILSKSSKDIKEWQKEWHKFFTDNEKNLTPYENVWYIFDTAVSSIGLFTEKTDDIIEDLKSVKKSISHEKNHQLLKDKIQQIQSTANKLSKEITDLKRQEVKLRTQINEQRTDSWRNTLKKKVFRTHQNTLNEKLNDVSRSIKDKDKSFKKEDKIFHREAVNIIEQNIKAELRLTLSMKQQFTDFVKSFDKNPNEFNEALAQCNPKTDLEQWKQNILYKNPEQSFESSEEGDEHDKKTSRHLKSVKSRSNENESSDENTKQRLKSVKSRSNENEHIDEKICQTLKSVKSRSTENGNSDCKKTIRQPLLRSTSVVDKNRDKKTKTPQKSSEFQAVNSDDTADDN